MKDTIITLDLEAPEPPEKNTWTQRRNGWIRTGSDPRHSAAQTLAPAQSTAKNKFVSEFLKQLKQPGASLPDGFADEDGRQHVFQERIR